MAELGDNSMKVAIVTGSGGLIGSESVLHFSKTFDLIVGIDNDMRARFFGDEASTRWLSNDLSVRLANYRHVDCDIRDSAAIAALFGEFSSDIKLVVHTAAQPSHDWAAREPKTDFSVNANGTLELLEATRQFCPDAVFIFTSTNKVYGDTPNRLPLVEGDSRWEVRADHPFAAHGIDESMSIDQSTHSLFGVSKTAADILVQEYGRYFGLKSAVFRGGCLTGPNHSGTQLHGFLAYLMKCTMSGLPYTVFGYKAKQVRDNIHSADLIAAFDAVYQDPPCGAVYNIGGGIYANCSMIEAISLCEDISRRKLQWTYSEQNRVGDHIWYVSDLRRFQARYPSWHICYDIRQTLEDIHDGLRAREALLSKDN